MWGATTAPAAASAAPGNFNPRSPCGERLGKINQALIAKLISIHAPRVGSDALASLVSELVVISIHAPRVGSDPRLQLFDLLQEHFNPRSPCGERLAVAVDFRNA